MKLVSTLLFSILIPTLMLSGCSKPPAAPAVQNVKTKSNLVKGKKTPIKSTAKKNPIKKDPAAVTTKPKTTPTKTAESTIPANSRDVSITFKAPAFPVDGFLIRFGIGSPTLNNQTKKLTSELELTDDPSLGALYRIHLTGVPRNKIIYLTISSFVGETISQPSELIEVAAE